MIVYTVWLIFVNFYLPETPGQTGCPYSSHCRLGLHHACEAKNVNGGVDAIGNGSANAIGNESASANAIGNESASANAIGIGSPSENESENGNVNVYKGVLKNGRTGSVSSSPIHL
jgi:hypothetical protein